MTRSNTTVFLSVVAALGLTATVKAQPTLTSLGGGSPISVTNELSGTYYIGGSGISSTAAARWSLTGATLMATEVVGSAGGGYLATDDAAFMTTLIQNGTSNETRIVVGNATTSAVSPAFNAPSYAVPASLAPSATSPAFTEFFGARYSVAGNSFMNMGGVPIIPFTPNPLITDPNDPNYVGNSGVFGSSSSGQSTSNFISPHRISANGRFLVGQAYVCVYNAGATAGTSISANSFYWRPVIWDAQGNAGAGEMTVLPTPFRTSALAGANTRRRTGNPYAVSNDGLVVVGATEHNVGTTPGPDVDGGRLVVWRYDTGTSTWGMSYLDTGLDGSGFPKYVSTTPSAVAMNSSGTIIVARGPDGITKWVWNGTSWGAPNVLGAYVGLKSTIDTISCDNNVALVTTTTDHGLTAGDFVYIVGNSQGGYNGLKSVTNVPSTTTFEYTATCTDDGTGGTAHKAPSWLPTSVTSCAAPPNVGGILAMTDDGNTIVGSVTYSTCGSFMSQGFIWHHTDNTIKDWYDWNVTQNTPGCSTGGFWGPIGDLGNPARGQPVLGNPNAISPDGSAIVGRQGGTQVIVGAPPWIWQSTGGPACVPASITNNPTATTNFSACTSSIILNVSASGTPPLSYQWYKGATPLVAGPTGNGADFSFPTPTQMRITPPTGTTLSAGEAGTYTCVVTGQCGAPATTTDAVVQLDPAFPAATNDTCATATAIVQGTNVLGVTGPSPCAAYSNDPALSPSCSAAKTDLWYSFTPSSTGAYRIETCGANFDTVLSIFDGCMGSELACNDNLDPNQGPACSASNRSRILSVNLTENQPYLIQLSAKSTGFISTTSTFNLSIIPAPAPAPNDDCSNPTVAVVSPTLASPGNSLDTSEAIAGSTTNCTATVTARDVWFQYTTPATPACGRIALTTCPGGGTWNSVIEVFDFCGGTVLACNDNMSTTGTGAPAGCTASSQAGIRMMPTVANTTYYIRVGGNNATAFGTGKLHIFVLGDTDGDGARTPSDITTFVNAMLSGTYNIFADMDGSGAVNARDIQPFVDCLAQ